jgi:hypothetical protein
LGYFEQLLSMPLGKNGIDISVMTAFRLDRTRHSIATNGHYFSGPLTSLAFNPATYQFTYRFFANHTAENPEGYLDAKTLMSFQGVTGEKGNYKWARGQERIPENVSTHCNHSGTAALSVTITASWRSLPKPFRSNYNTPN